ncbi:replicative DNA helicase [Geotalea uraniireducens]|uniref:DNA 5'-3' helicase n=1 Tax=Geotalea uraniireducens TaxID=351604 RepID=A0ABM8EPF9_9BACT|nr:DnaB-like helicase C-terminal domain-containing protein [Geotalea uraniireducens]BDV44107.1 replicative DNA helicase [Geotalea uraniireducens]
MHNNANTFSQESEMSILGSVFIENSCLQKVAGIIEADDFYRESHRKLFRAMVELHRQKNPIDLVTMTDRLKRHGELEEVGGAAYLATLVDYVPTAANIAYYCKIVKEKSVSRQVAAFAAELADKACGENPGEILSEAKLQIQEITGRLDGINGVSASDLLNFDQRQERYQRFVRDIERERFKTGFALLDQCIRGVAPGEVLTIAAYSGTFKTAFLQNLLLRGAAATGLCHLLFSLEMPAEKVFERELQIQGGATGREVEDHYRGHQDSESVRTGENQASSQGLIVCDRPRLSVEKVARYVEIALQRHKRLGAVGIDYLGLMQAPGKTVFDKTAHISAEMKNMAKELRVPVILLSQINRQAATAGGEIEMHSAKGGGDVEAGADFMLGFWRDKSDTLICKVMKNRNGAVGMNFDVNINRETLQFVDMTPYTPAKVSRKNPF